MSTSLKENEIKILMETPIWPKENSSLQSNKGKSEEIKQDLQSNKDKPEEIKPGPKIQRFVASELYAPTAIHREFGLPMLSWKGKWVHNTQEGKFFVIFYIKLSYL